MAFLGLSEGWALTVFNNEEELAFIRRGQEGNDVLASYYIGGSTDAQKGTNLN